MEIEIPACAVSRLGPRARRVGLALVIAMLGASGARAGSASGRSWCAGNGRGWKILGPSPASSDLYNGLLWIGGAGGIALGADAKFHWTHVDDFDKSARNSLRLGTASARERANRASDALLGLSFGLHALAIGQTLFVGRDCDEAYDMATDLVESVGLVTLLVESTKFLAGRERPFGLECDGTPPDDAHCGGDSRKQSFFSGHAALSAAGAGVTCAYALERNAWGETTLGRVVPCALGIGLAASTAMMRVAGDKHWVTDVVTGLAVGAVVGYFDTWGPFDLLHFEVPARGPLPRAEGVILPWTGGGVLGTRLALRF